jgi:L-ascorbate metabolism protein UlaG (beta-lactamase superfamily)
MRIQWYGQSAFALAGEHASVFIDPFGDMSPAAARGLQFDYPAIEGVEPDLLLVTHEHLDHNGVEAIGGDPAVLRSTAGRHESPPARSS